MNKILADRGDAIGCALCALAFFLFIAGHDAPAWAFLSAGLLALRLKSLPSLKGSDPNGSNDHPAAT